MAFELSCQSEAVLIGHLLGRRAGGIIQLLEYITCSYRIGYSPTGEEVAQRRTEGLCRGEEHAAIADGITLHKVEETIGTCLVIIVQTVTAQSSQQGNILGLGLRNVVDVSTGRIALVLDIQTELGTLDVRCEIVNVLHHQLPVGLLRIVGGVLQRLDEKRLVGIGIIGGKLTDFIGRAAKGVFVGNGKHLVALQRRLQRDITHGFVQGVFRTVEQACRRQFLVVRTSHEKGGRQRRADLINIAGIRIVGDHVIIFSVGTVGGQLRRRSTTPFRRSALCQLGESDDITGVRRRSRLVGNPHLNTGNLDACRNDGQALHGLIIVLTEILGKEEVTVFLIVGYIQLERSGLRATFRGNALRRGVLLRQHGLELQLTELQVGAHAKQAAGALNQRVVRRESDVTGLNQFDNLVLLALVAQLQVLRVEVEGSVGVVIQRHIHLITNLTRHVDIDFLIEIDTLRLTVTDGE